MAAAGPHLYFVQVQFRYSFNNLTVRAIAAPPRSDLFRGVTSVGRILAALQRGPLDRFSPKPPLAPIETPWLCHACLIGAGKSE